MTVETLENKILFPEYEEYFRDFEKEVERGSKSEHSLRSYKFAINHMILYFMDRFGIKGFGLGDIESIDAKLLREYRNLAFNEVKNSTVNARFRCINTFFNWLVENEYLEKNPLEKVKNLKEEKVVKEILSEEEMIKMINACQNLYEKATIVMLVSTAARRSELVNILREDVKDGHVLIRFGKGKKERLIPIQPEVEEFLKDYFEKVPGEYVIVSQRGNHQVTTETIRHIVKSVAERAGIDPERLEKISCHTFRRSRASQLLNDDVESFFVRDFLGHSSSVVTARYATVRNDAMDKAIMKSQAKVL